MENTAALRKKKIKSVVIICLVLSSIVFSQTWLRTKSTDTGTEDNSTFKRLNKKMLEIVNANKLSGLSVAVIEEGKILWAGAYGYRDIDNDEPVNVNTMFDAASMSKPVTAYLTLKMVDRGEIDLDEPLYKYLPLDDDLKDQRQKLITPRMVLTHTTGLPNWGKNFIRDPGEEFGYSGEAFVYLGRAIERIKKKPLHEILHEEVLKPLGMNNSSFIWNKDYEKNAASGHDIDGKVLEIKKYRSAHGAGTLATTASDYAKFVIAIIKGTGLRNKTRDSMLIRRVKAENWDGPEKIPHIYWGLGWGIHPGKNGDCFFHMGNNRYWRGYVVANPKTQRGVVYFSNCENGHAAARDIVNLVIEDFHWGLQLVGNQ